MCDFIDAFAPAAKQLVLPAPIRGTGLAEAALTQKDYALHNPKGGRPLTVTSGGQCLCGFDDWPALYALGRATIEGNALPWMSFLWFWASDRYTLGEREVDPYDDEVCVKPRRGEVLVLRPEPPARRRHKLHVRTLSRAIDRPLVLALKGGREIRGSLVAFDAESEVGRLDDETFVVAQVHAITPQD